MLHALLAAALLLPAPRLAFAAGGSEEMTAAQYHAGLKTLRGYMEKRGEHTEAAERFIAVMDRSLPPSEGDRVPVTHDVFAAFTRYQAAWARKTRDSKNPRITPAQLEKERERAAELKERFRTLASEKSPVFYRVFQAAVQEVRRAPRRGGAAYAGDSAVFFGDQIDNSYSHVDAGDVALEKGDTAGAIAEAGKALAENPANPDAFVLRAGAKYERGDTAAAVADAQSALILDPGNQQAKAIMSLSGAALAGEAARQALPSLGAFPEAAAASPTPAVGALLSAEYTARAVDGSRDEPRAAIEQLDRAITLNARNAPARSWRAAILNRIGDHAGARASADLALRGDPEDAGAWFDKAYALAGERDGVGVIVALNQAARADKSYQALLERALRTPGPEDMKLLFEDWSASHTPAVPRSRRRQPLPLLLLGGLGVLLALVGVAQLFRRGR